MEDVNRGLQEIINECVAKGKNGAIISVDFSKAFDKVSHLHILKCLKRKGFGPQMINAIGCLLHNLKSRIKINGDTSTIFNIQRSCRQGDPIAPLLFDIAIDCLADLIQDSKTIKGVEICNEICKSFKFADDVNFTTSGTKDDIMKAIQEVEKIIQNFKNISGLELNLNKTKILRFGPWSNEPPENLGNTTNDLNLLGSIIKKSEEESILEQKKIILKKLKKRIFSFKNIKLNIMEKIFVWNSLIISKVIYLLRQVPYCENTSNAIEKKKKAFPWNSKRPRISQQRLHEKTKQGGLGLLHTEPLWRAMNFSWIRRLFNSTETWAKIIKKRYSTKYGVNLNEDLDQGPDRILAILNKGSTFWKGTAEAIKPICQKLLNEIEGEMPLTSNSAVQANGQLLVTQLPNIRVLADIEELTNNDLPLQLQMEVSRLKKKFPKRNIKCRPRIPYIRHLQQLPNKRARIKIKLEGKSPPKIFGKFHNKLGITKETTGKIIGEVRKRIFKPKGRWFKYRLASGTLTTNKIEKTEEGQLCTFCKTVPETLSHIFIQCVWVSPIVEHLKNAVSEAWNANIDDNEMLTMTTDSDFKNHINLLVTKVQRIIYRFKTVKEKPPPSLKKLIDADISTINNIF